MVQKLLEDPIYVLFYNKGFKSAHEKYLEQMTELFMYMAIIIKKNQVMRATQRKNAFFKYQDQSMMLLFNFLKKIPIESHLAVFNRFCLYETSIKDQGRLALIQFLLSVLNEKIENQGLIKPLFP